MSSPVYATATDFANYAVPALATADIDPAVITAELESASRRADDYLGARYPLPLSQWPSSLTMMVCYIAARNVLATRGYNPDSGSDALVQTRYEEAIAWLEGVERQRIHPQVVAATVADPNYQLPQVFSFPSRGW